jgi:DNA-binding FrmR family transcriptional regulator
MEHIKPGPAQGSAHILEKVSGPEGTYSALEIMVGAEVPCRALSVEIAKAQKASVELCRDMLEDVFEQQYADFKEHVDKAGRK